MNSSQLTRPQLVAMIARLRGTILSAQMVMEDHGVVIDADDMLEPTELDDIIRLTTFDVSDSDCGEDGWFDKSWEKLNE